MMRLGLLLLAILLWTPLAAHADKGDESLRARMDAHADSLTVRAKTLLQRFLAEDEFVVVVAVDGNETLLATEAGKGKDEVALETLPGGLPLEQRKLFIVQRLTPETLSQYVARISVSVTLDKGIPKEREKTVRQNLQKALRLNEKRGDFLEVLFDDLLLGSTRKKMEDLNQSATSRERALREGERELLSLRAERQKLQTELESAKVREKQGQSDLDDVKRKLTAADEEMRRLREDLEDRNSPLGRLRLALRGFERIVAILMAALFVIPTLLLMLFVYVRAQAGSQRQLVAAFQALAEAVPKIGKSGSGGQSRKSASESLLLKEQSNRPSQSEAELVKLQQDAHDAWESLSKHRISRLAVLRRWCADPRFRMGVAAVAQSLPPAEGAQIVERLPAEDMQQILEEFAAGDKTDSGASWVVRLFFEVQGLTRSRPHFLDELTELEPLFALSSEALTELAGGLETESLAVLLSLFPPNLTARILAGSSPEVCRGVLARLGTAHEISLEDARKHAKTILVHSSPLLQKKVVAADELVMALLDEPDLKLQGVVRDFLEVNPELDAKVRSKVITMAEVVRLENEVLDELLEELTPHDIAVLLIGMDQEDAQRLTAVIPKKMLATVQSEGHRIMARPSSARRARLDSAEIQKQICTRVLTMIQEGVLERPGPKALLETAGEEAETIPADKQESA